MPTGPEMPELPEHLKGLFRKVEGPQEYPPFQPEAAPDDDACEHVWDFQLCVKCGAIDDGHTPAPLSGTTPRDAEAAWEAWMEGRSNGYLLNGRAAFLAGWEARGADREEPKPLPPLGHTWLGDAK